MEQYCVGYACQRLGFGLSRESIEERLRAECASRFPDMAWGGLFADAFDSRPQSLVSRPSGGELTRIIYFRRGTVGAVIFASAYDGFKTVADLELTLRCWGPHRVNVVALDIDLGDPASIAEWGRSLHRLRAIEAAAIARAARRPTGKPPLGFEWRRRRDVWWRVPRPDELRAMAKAHEWTEQGFSRNVIATKLMLSGFRSPRTGNEWSPSTCWRAARAFAGLLKRGIVTRTPGRVTLTAHGCGCGSCPLSAVYDSGTRWNSVGAAMPIRSRSGVSCHGQQTHSLAADAAPALAFRR